MSRAVVFSGANVPLEMQTFENVPLHGAAVRVAVVCCTLCRSDLHTHAGRRVEPTPTVLGHEIVGRIAEFGPDAARVDASGVTLDIGSRVSWAIAVGCGRCFFCDDDLPQKCEQPAKYGHRRLSEEAPPFGGLADSLVLAPGTVLYSVSETVSDPVAAFANCAVATVAACLRAAGPIAGRTVLVLGAGTLGVSACAMSRAFDAARVLAADPEPACRDRAQAFGADHVFPTEPDDLTAGVLGATANRGADIVLELSGARDSVAAALSLARTGGTILLAGTAAPVGTVPLAPEQIVRRMLTLRGVHNYHPRDLETALAFLAGPGRAFPFDSLVAAEYPLEQAEDAFAFAHTHPGVRVAVRP